MYIREVSRQKKNEKVLEFSIEILQICEKEKFTLADVKDLANVLPNMIGEALIKLDETHVFTAPRFHEEFQNNNVDIRPQNFDIDQ